MFRNKLAVDRHVQDLFRKVMNENERAMRCYNIAKLYYHVEDYESARRYVLRYLEVKDDQSGPHKLLGKIYEALGQKEPALAQYKQSLELEPRQDDLVLKVCELLVDMDIGHDVHRAKYWVDRADEKFPHHPTVFQLKEKLLSLDKQNSNGEDLEALIAGELSVRPSDVNLRVKLLRYYVEKNRLEDAYKHALEVESSHAHRDSIVWYEALCDLLSRCKRGRETRSSFWLAYVSALERYAALSLKEQGNLSKKTIPEAAQAVFNFDQSLTEAKTSNDASLKHMFSHMWGQLHFHLACYLLRKTKREQGSWKDAGRLCIPLLLTAIHVPPIDPAAIWAQNTKEPSKSQIRVWRREASYRCSQAHHVLQSYARENVRRMMDQVDKFFVGAWRERIYLRIFVSKAHVATSYFANHQAPNPPLRLCSTSEIKNYDEASEEVWPASLHHHVWLGIVNSAPSPQSNVQDDNSEPRPHQYCHVFPDLQLSIFNLSQAAPDSLGQLDIEAFLNAAILCASVIVEEQQRSGFVNPDRLQILPADITNTLCTAVQEKWWASAYKIYSKRDELTDDIGEIRQELQRGLEVVRCIGNHGLHPAILVHLARIFHYRAKALREKDENHADLPFVEARCELYWSAVVPLLERLLNNQSIRTTNTKIFDYQGKAMNNVELTNALEEGRLLLAQRFVRDKQHEQAIEALQALKCPQASFMQGTIYENLAEELMSNLPKECLTSAMRSQHIVMLSKARDCYYLTLDRLRSPGMNPKHPLNSELGTRIDTIENALKKIDPDVWRANRNECDALSEESYSSAHSGEQPANRDSIPGALGHSIHMLGTPQKCTSLRTPKQASTPCRIQHQDVLELSKKSLFQQEARPSPERLDAQIRQLIYSKDNMIQTILDQNKTLLETNKALVESTKKMHEKIEELQKQFANFCKERPSSRQNPARASQSNLGEDLYVIDDEYDTMGVSPGQHMSQNVSQPLPPNLFVPQPRNLYSGLIYPQAPIPNYYAPSLPFNDPQNIPSLYGNSRGVQNVFPMPGYYPRPPIDPALQAMPKVPDNVQGMFGNRLMNQLTDFGAPLQQGGGMLGVMQQLSLDATRNEIPAKDVSTSQPGAPSSTTMTATTRALPVNVVITTSDTLPTTAPSVQPQLSVTIPPQYRATSGTTPVNLGGPLNAPGLGMPLSFTGPSLNSSASSSTTSNLSQNSNIFQPSNISQNFNIIPASTTQNLNGAKGSALHSYQISMPSQALIPTTVILPPLSTTITNTIAEQERKNQSAHNCSSEGSEYEADPLPDFVPIIPLPAEVQVTTGEEDEETLFSARAKLYRWSDREWKERGVGHVKILKNPEGKVRLVMRREQVLKICANHMLTSDMELTRMASNDRAWIWVANDFADEELRLEKLCIKFKFVEEALSFKESFDKAKTSKIVSQPEAASRKLEVAPKAPETVEKASPGRETSKPTTLGGFSFSTEPKVQEVPSSGPRKLEETRPSPFADFSFTKSDSSGFSFKSSTKAESNVPKAGIDVSKVGSDEKTTRKPQKASQNANEVIGSLENSEIVFYEKKASLMRSSEAGAWKNRGLGTVKIILEPKTGNLRLHVRRDETEKIFCNSRILARAKFTIFTPGGDNFVTWSDVVKGKTENFGILFDSGESASHFRETIAKLQKAMTNDAIPGDSWRQEGTKIRLEAKEKSLAEIFKPPSGSWECECCYTRNQAGSGKCVSCEAARPGEKPSEAPAKGKIDEKPIQEDKSSLWSQFKPQPDSWECQSCYIRNSRENSYCVACDAPKDPSMPPKPRTSGFRINEASESPGFSFGIPRTSSQPETKGFTFGVPSGAPGFNFSLASNDEKQETKPISIFGAKPTNAPTNFTFEMPQRPTTPQTENSFTFGSPGKSFDFQFPAKSPTKSPGEKRGDVSEDEVAESEDVYFAPVVPLPDKIEVKTGEEDEEVLYAHRAKLFRFDSSTKEWKERGLGDIKILRNPSTGKLRLVMRRDQTLKLCLNHAVNDSIEFKPKDDKTWLWNAADYSEGDIERLQLACRFKTPEIANDFKIHLDQALENVRQADSNEATDLSRSSSTTNENTITNVKKDNENSHQDIQVVYEVKTSAEEKAAALKLQLPENFYAYTRKSDCPGCRGCEEPETPVFQEAQKSVSQSPGVKLAPPKLTSPGTTKSGAEASGDVQRSIFQVGNAGSVDEPKQFSGFVFGTGEKSLFSGSGEKSIFSGSGEKSIFSGSGEKSIFSGSGEKSLFSGSGEKPLFSGSGEKSLFSGSGEKSMFSGTGQKLGGTLDAENLTICSPSQPKTSESQPSFGKSPFEAPLFGASGLSGVSPATSIFGGNATKTSEPGLQGAPEVTSLFGGPTRTTGSSGFGFEAPSLASLVNSGSLRTSFAEAHNGQPSFGSLADKISAKEPEVVEDVSTFLPVQSGVSFSTLAAQTSTNAFKKDPNFSFAGAGAAVFGAKTQKSVSKTGSDAKNDNSDDKTGNDAKTGNEPRDNEADDNQEDDEDNAEEHDPHFEPIIPLPDAVEVRTGEEDEDVVFSERAKLFRYESGTKEWKERGTGQMKLLHHTEHGTYRLLLRREQVHKVVCNLLVTSELELMPLNSSDRAWMWAAFNHAEEPFGLEELAVKFKTPESAVAFKQAVDAAKLDVQERHARGQERITEADLSECYGEDEDGDDDDEPSVIFASRADLLILQGNTWTTPASGTLRILYDTEIYGAKIIVEADNTGEILSNTFISMETTMEINKNACTWTAIDEVPNPPIRRTLKAIFATEELAHEMFVNFQDGLQYANQADISETSYYDPRNEQ